MKKKIVARTLAALAVAAGVVGLAPGISHAGAPPARLDRNFGLVIPHATIQNIYWDSGWNTHHPAFRTTALDAFTRRLTTSSYLASASQYGVSGAVFNGGNLANSLCGATRAPNQLSHALLLAWITCEVTVPFTGVEPPALGLPASSSLYIVYLPANSRLSDDFTVPTFTVFGHRFGGQRLFHFASCSDYLAFHSVGFVGPQPFSYSVVPAMCAGSIDDMTVSASHEIIESLTDPVGGGWLDDTLGLEGEAGDLCENSPSVHDALTHFAFTRYWSNRQGACVAF